MLFFTYICDRIDQNAQREATHFKNRILDLVDIFVKKQFASPLTLRLVLPLVELALGSGSDEQQLSSKAGGLLKSRIGKLKDVPTPVDSENTAKILEDLHTRARKAHSAEALAIISPCSLYIVRTLLHAQVHTPVYDAYRTSLGEFATRKASDLNAKFFEEFFKRQALSAWHLRDDLLDLTGKAVNTYRQCQIFGLIQVLVNQLPSMVGTFSRHCRYN
jgi:DNA polymerase phi